MVNQSLPNLSRCVPRMDGMREYVWIQVSTSSSCPWRRMMPQYS